MKLSIIAAAFAFLIGVPGLTGVEITKTGPDRPAPIELAQGGGGGP